jgi:hypothetical protein
VMLSSVVLTCPLINEAVRCDERDQVWNVIGNIILFVFKQCV